MANRWGNNGNSGWLYFGGAPKSLQMVTAAMKLRHLLLGRKVMTPRWHIKKQRHYFTNTGSSSQSYSFSSSHVWMWELDYKESWAPKNWRFWSVVLEKTLKSPLDCKEIQPVSPKGNQSWIFIERLVLKLKLQYTGHLIWRTESLGKTLTLGKIEGRRKRTTEDETVGWHHILNGHGFEQALRVGDGQGGLTCCSPRGGKESDMTEWLKWTELKIISKSCLKLCLLSQPSGLS